MDTVKHWVSFGRTESGDSLTPLVWPRKPTHDEVDEQYKKLYPEEYEEVGFVNFKTEEAEEIVDTMTKQYEEAHEIIENTNAGLGELGTISIGWTIIDPETGSPQRTVRSQGNRHERKEPVKVYPTKKRAESFAMPGNVAVEVFV